MENSGRENRSSKMYSRDISLLSHVDDDLLNEIENLCRVQGNLSDQALLALHSVYGNSLERALELLEKNCVTYLRVPKGIRYAIQVSGSSGVLYTLFPGINYCPCLAYRYQVAGTRTDMTCKHVIAARLAEILGQGKELQVSGNALIRILLNSAGLNTS